MKSTYNRKWFRPLTKNLNSIIVLVLLSISITTVYAQSPQKMTYQSVVRDASGNLLTNTTVGIQINILQGSASGASVYIETYSPALQTDDNGWVSLAIGSGAPSTGVFADIDWVNGPYFLLVEIDPLGGTSYTINSTSELLSVPYALYAETSGSSNTNDSWSLSGNAGIDSAINFIGTTDDQALKFKIFNIPFGELNESTGSMFFGKSSGLNNTGDGNIGFGSEILLDNTGDGNIGIGKLALKANTTGNDNIGIGDQALTASTTGDDNIGMGNQVLKNNTRGSSNIAIGFKSLSNNKLGIRNIAIGTHPLYSNKLGQNNIAIGTNSLYSNEAGYNLAIGDYALFVNTVGTYNTAIGVNALISNSLGNNNTAIGSNVMPNVTVGKFNTAIGDRAMASVTTSLNNTAIGTDAMPNATGFNNTAIGHEAEVGNPAASHQVRIGNSQITSATIQVPWASPSDKKWKEQIRPLRYGLDFVSQLKPVDYIRKNNEAKTREIGFIAQDIEKLLTTIGYSDQGLLSKDSKGGLSLRYNDFIPLLTKAIQELDAKNQALQKMNIELIKRIEKLEQRK